MIASVFRRLLKRRQAATAAVRRPTVRLAFETLEDRVTPSTSTLYVGTGEPFATITSAVNAAKANDTIVVEPGTYTEQVVIGPGLNGLTLTTASGKPDATIQMPPPGMTGFPAIVEISSSKNVTINDFNINGNSNTQYGIRVDGGASATITANNITTILGNNGAGIDLGDNAFSPPQIGSGTVVGNSVNSYTTVGIVVNNAGSVATVANNRVTGTGAPAQYGIQVSNGANADVRGNYVTGNTNPAGSSAGIFTSNSGSCTTIESNSTTGNEYGILIYYSNNVAVANNNSYQNSNDGIQLLYSSNTLVIGNNSLHNGGDGISIYGSPAINNTLFANTIGNNAGNGVTIDDANNNSVEFNAIFDNGMSGVAIDPDTPNSSSGNLILFNYIDQDNTNYAAISVSPADAKTNHIAANLITQ